MKKLAVGLIALSVMGIGGCQKEEVKEVKSEAPAPAAAVESVASPASAAVAFETNEQKASYGMGLNIGRSFERQQYQVDTDALISGIMDAINKTDPKLEKTAIDEAFAAIREQIKTKQEEEAKTTLEAGKKFLEENAKKEGIVTLESGLQYQVITAVDGAESPGPKDTVKTHYHGTLIDGTVFDSSVERGQPAEFPVNRVIPGWIEALQKMKVGEKWKLFIPSGLAYGQRSPSPKIPANSALVFDVELLEITKKEAPAAAPAPEGSAAPAPEASPAPAKDETPAK